MQKPIEGSIGIGCFCMRVAYRLQYLSHNLSALPDDENTERVNRLLLTQKQYSGFINDLIKEN
jgi:hypothetical protein